MKKTNNLIFYKTNESKIQAGIEGEANVQDMHIGLDT